MLKEPESNLLRSSVLLPEWSWYSRANFVGLHSVGKARLVWTIAHVNRVIMAIVIKAIER